MSDEQSFERASLRRGIGILPDHVAAGILDDIRSRESESSMAESYPKDTIDAKLEAIEARMDARLDKTLNRFDAVLVEMQADRRVSDERYSSLEKRFTHLSNQMTWGFSLIGIIVALAAAVLTAVTLLAG